MHGVTATDPMSGSRGRRDLWGTSGGGGHTATNGLFGSNEVDNSSNLSFDRPISAPPPLFDAFSPSGGEISSPTAGGFGSQNGNHHPGLNNAMSLLDEISNNNHTIGSSSNDRRGAALGTEFSSMKDYYYAGNSLTWDSQTFKRIGGLSRLFSTTRLEGVDETCERPEITATKATAGSQLEDLFTRPLPIHPNLDSNTDTVRSLPTSNSSRAVSDLQSLFIRPPTQNNGVATSQQYASSRISHRSSDTPSSASFFLPRSSYHSSATSTVVDGVENGEDAAENTHIPTFIGTALPRPASTGHMLGMPPNGEAEQPPQQQPPMATARRSFVLGRLPEIIPSGSDPDAELQASNITNALSCLNSPTTTGGSGRGSAPPSMSLPGGRGGTATDESGATSKSVLARPSPKTLLELVHDGNQNRRRGSVSSASNKGEMNGAAQSRHSQPPPSTTSAGRGPTKASATATRGGHPYHSSMPPVGAQTTSYQYQYDNAYSGYNQHAHQQSQQYSAARSGHYMSEMDHASINALHLAPAVASNLTPHQQSYTYAAPAPYGHPMNNGHPQLSPHLSGISQSQYVPQTPHHHPGYPPPSHSVYASPEHHFSPILEPMNAYSPSSSYAPAPHPVYSHSYHPGTSASAHHQHHHAQQVSYPYHQTSRTATLLYPHGQSSSAEPQAAYIVHAPAASLNVAEAQHYVVVQHTPNGQVVLAPASSAGTVMSSTAGVASRLSPASSAVSLSAAVVQPVFGAGGDRRRDSKGGRGMSKVAGAEKSKGRGERSSTMITGRKPVDGGKEGTTGLLEEFKRTHKSREWSVQNQVKGHVIEFCQDQNGSRFLQSQLDSDPAHVEGPLILQEILENLSAVKNDVFGNYVLQKILERGSDDMRSNLWFSIKGEIMDLSLQMYGCRVVQKALETLRDEHVFELITEFHGHVLQLIEDQNGNHVCQKLIEVLSKRSKARPSSEDGDSNSHSKSMEFIIEDVIANISRLSCHPYGCRVLQRILEHCVRSQTNEVLKKISECKAVLLGDQYGNYVIQHVLQYGRVEDREGILNLVLAPGNGVLKLSRQKFASNVVEKLLKFGNPDQRRRVLVEMLKEVTEDEAEGPCVIVLLMVRDPYANYVVQTTLDVAPEGEDRQQLLAVLNANSEKLRNYTFAKHIVAKLCA